MHCITVNEDGVNYIITPKLEGIYNRELKLTGYEMLSCVNTEHSARQSSAYFFDNAGIANIRKIIKIQCANISMMAHALRKNNLVISFNINLSVMRVILSDEKLSAELQSMNDVIRMELNEKLDVSLYFDEIIHLGRISPLWLDDFGCGNFHQQMRIISCIECIKVDKNVIHSLLALPSGKRILRTVVLELRASGCKVLAEGVEDENQLATLIACGFDRFQGWYWKTDFRYDERASHILV